MPTETIVTVIGAVVVLVVVGVVVYLARAEESASRDTGGSPPADVPTLPVEDRIER